MCFPLPHDDAADFGGLPRRAGGVVCAQVVLCALFLCAAGCSDWAGKLSGPLPTCSPQSVSQEAGDGQSWPAWRGGMARGVSPAESLPLTFSDRRRVRWKTPLEGAGNSSPIVVGERVFLSSVVGEGHRSQLRVMALDRRSGKLDWHADLGHPVGQTHQRNGHASATLASDGEHLLAYFGAKGLFCFSVEGERRWHRPYPKEAHEWGAASSPVLAGGMAIQLVDSQADSFLAAYDVVTGDEIWQTPRQSNGCWTTPAIASVHGAWQVIVNGSGSSDGSPGSVTGYDLATGRRLWSIEGTSDIVCPTALVGEDVIVSASGSNGPVIAIESDWPAGDSTPPIRWRLPTGGAYVPTGVIYCGRIYLVSDDGMLRCLDPADGRQIWRQRLGAPVSASLVAGAGRVYVTSEPGDIFVVAAADQFELLATNSLHELCLATPAVADEEFFIRGERHLFCISDKTEQAQRAAPATNKASGNSAAETRQPAGETVASPSDLPVASGDGRQG